MLQGLVSLPEWSVSYRSTSDVIIGGSRHFVWGGGTRRQGRHTEGGEVWGGGVQ